MAPSSPPFGLYKFLNLACSARRATAGAFDRCASATHTSGPFPAVTLFPAVTPSLKPSPPFECASDPRQSPQTPFSSHGSLSASISGFEPATFASPSKSLSTSSSSVAARANAACLAAICAIAAI